jgi:hypothetical protein
MHSIHSGTVSHAIVAHVAAAVRDGQRKRTSVTLVTPVPGRISVDASAMS